MIVLQEIARRKNQPVRLGMCYFKCYWRMMSVAGKFVYSFGQVLYYSNTTQRAKVLVQSCAKIPEFSRATLKVIHFTVWK